jgi:HNH endonuclease
VSVQFKGFIPDLGYTSLFNYSLKELNYSEQQAWRRINAMRVLRTLPELKHSVDNGSLSLSSINLASGLFREANIKSKQDKLGIFEQMKNLTKAQCEDKVYKMKKDLGIDKTPKRTIINKATPEIARVHVNLSKETLEKIEKVKNLTKENDLDKIISLLADTYINHKIEVKRETKNIPAKNSRYIPRKIKETIYKRADGQCENCGSTHHLEFHHITPFAKGGTNDVSNIKIFCKNCNSRQAIKDFGQEKMDLFLNTLPGSVQFTEIFHTLH